MTNWNDFVITRYGVGSNNSNSNPPQPQSVPTSSIPFTLTDGTGASTTAQVTSWSGGNTFSTYGSTQTVPNAQLLNGFLGGINDTAHPNHPATLTISNVPYSSGYNVYVYFTNNNPSTSDIQGQISLTSGSYTSPTYYLQAEGPETPTTVPFFVSGTSSTTAGNYTNSNYVEIPVPAIGTQGASSVFTVTVASPATGSNQVTPGLAGVEVVANGAGPSFANAMSVTSNSAIDVTGVNSAGFNTLSIGAKTLAITGGSTGSDDPYTLSFGATTLTGNATFQVADNTSGSGAQGTLQLGAISQSGGNFGIAIKGPGQVVFTAPGSYSGPTLIDNGQLVLTNGTATGNSNGVTVFPGGALVLQNSSGSSMTFGQAVAGGKISTTINGAGLAANPVGAIVSLTGTNTYAGPITLASSATISAAANSTLTLSNSIVVPTGDSLQFGGSGTVVTTGGLNLEDGAAIQLSGGTTQLNPGTVPTIGAGTSVTVASGATLQLAGSTSALSNSSSGNSASVVNNGTLSITGSAETVGAISGGGTTTVADGANLTASQIVQSSLIVGNGSTVAILPQTGTPSGVVQSSFSSISPAVASVAAGSSSSSSSNPFAAIETMIIADQASGEFASDGLAIEADLASAETQLNLTAISNSALLAEYQIFSAGGSAAATEPMLMHRAIIDKSIWNLENAPPVVNDIGTSLALADGSLAIGAAAPVPEPSALVLAAIGLIGVCIARRRMRRAIVA